jgi:hypothetical protein
MRVNVHDVHEHACVHVHVRVEDVMQVSGVNRVRVCLSILVLHVDSACTFSNVNPFHVVQNSIEAWDEISISIAHKVTRRLRVC